MKGVIRLPTESAALGCADIGRLQNSFDHHARSQAVEDGVFGATAPRNQAASSQDLRCSADKKTPINRSSNLSFTRRATRAMAEIELSILSRQCINRRFESVLEMEHEINAWQTERNEKKYGANWQFTTQDARIKLKSLYPIQSDI